MNQAEPGHTPQNGRETHPRGTVPGTESHLTSAAHAVGAADAADADVSQPADTEQAEEQRRTRTRLRAQMVSAGFYDSGKSERWLEAPELAAVDRVNLFAGLRYAPSPDTALPALVRLIEKHPPVAERANSGENRWACSGCWAHPRRWEIFCTATRRRSTRSLTLIRCAARRSWWQLNTRKLY